MNLQEMIELQDSTKKEFGKLVREVEETKRSFNEDEKKKCKDYQATLNDLQAKIETRKITDSFNTFESAVRKDVFDASARFDLSTPKKMDAETGMALVRSFCVSKLKVDDRERDTQNRLSKMQLIAEEHGFNINSSRLNYWMPNSDDVKRSITTETQYQGQELIGKSFANIVTEYLQYYFNIWDVFDVFTTEKGDDFQSPTFDYRHLAATKRATQATAITEESYTNFFNQATFKAWEYFSDYIPVGRATLNDSIYNIPQLLAKAFAFAMGIAMEDAIFSSNAGTTQGQGILYGVDQSVSLSGGLITRSAVESAVNKINLSYVKEPGMAMFCNRATWNEIKNEQDSNGKEKWMQTLADGPAPAIECSGVVIPVHFTDQLTSTADLGTDDTGTVVALVCNAKYFGVRFAGTNYITSSEHYLWDKQQTAFMNAARFDHRWKLLQNLPACKILS